MVMERGQPRVQVVDGVLKLALVPLVLCPLPFDARVNLLGDLGRCAARRCVLPL